MNISKKHTIASIFIVSMVIVLILIISLNNKKMKDSISSSNDIPMENITQDDKIEAEDLILEVKDLEDKTDTTKNEQVNIVQYGNTVPSQVSTPQPVATQEVVVKQPALEVPSQSYIQTQGYIKEIHSKILEKRSQLNKAISSEKTQDAKCKDTYLSDLEREKKFSSTFVFSDRSQKLDEIEEDYEYCKELVSEKTSQYRESLQELEKLEDQVREIERNLNNTNTIDANIRLNSISLNITLLMTSY